MLSNLENKKQFIRVAVFKKFPEMGGREISIYESKDGGGDVITFIAEGTGTKACGTSWFFHGCDKNGKPMEYARMVFSNTPHAGAESVYYDGNKFYKKLPKYA